ncbi:ribonuclease HII [Mycoplasmatota bacterium]|nr:ribonuclease HII [Mycoplasmatota bacterium]
MIQENDLTLNKLIEEILQNSDDSKNEKEYLQYSKYIDMSAFENDLINRKVKVIAGIDEAGRGPLAGPVVASSVVLPNGFYLPGLNDSKKLSAKKRDYYYDEIINNAISYGVGIVDVSDIDKFNIYNSTKIAMIKSILNLSVKPKHLLIDAMKLEIDIPQTSIIKGDQKSISIAAASVIAKVTRDRLMQDLDKEYPGYNFKKNKGYGTKEHLNALKKYGVTPIHRKSFEPIKSMIKNETNLFNC